jgi:hypothetical protein
MRSRVKWFVAGLAVLVLAYAWFDGGEEPIVPMSHEIEVPENAG